MHADVKLEVIMDTACVRGGCEKLQGGLDACMPGEQGSAGGVGCNVCVRCETL